jgi:uncharacterized protein
MNSAKNIDTIALILVIIGGINWGLVGLLSFNLVDRLFGVGGILSQVIYSLVGVSAIYLAFVAKKIGKR